MEGNLVFRNVPTTVTNKTSSLCLKCLGKQCGLCWTPALIVGVWNFGMGPRMLMWPTPNINSGHWVSNEIPWKTTFQICCHNSLLGKLNIANVTLLKVDSWRLTPGVCRTLAHMPLLLLIFALYSFYLINYSHYCICMLSLMTPLRELLDLGSGLRDPWHG